ncbi:DMT family transporter [Pseudomonas luteola]|uniref:DMT family transporter n=1 Tax=Pseudomonas luteola TaxID=47886 RepID=UPI001EF44451|nr:DMT family transporter [Pseudomonas luteola]MCG7373809.1 DMT family transporter [Pseudomonas luteola]
MLGSLRTLLVANSATAFFVLLWSSGALFAHVGVTHAPAFTFLLLRFLIAFTVLLLMGLWRRRWLPSPGSRSRVALTGALLIGGYSICYLLALDKGVTPGVLATLLGVQPILTLVLVERRLSPRRLAGLLLALGGLSLLVYRSLAMAHLSLSGILYALAALLCMSIGAILQKGLSQPPADVLPLQVGISLVLCLLFVPFQPIRFELSSELVTSVLWMAVVISVLAQLLFYRLVQAGNLVNVTSLFYLVPLVTTLLDYLILGHRVDAQGGMGMVAILIGLVLVFRQNEPTNN